MYGKKQIIYCKELIKITVRNDIYSTYSVKTSVAILTSQLSPLNENSLFALYVNKNATYTSYAWIIINSDDN